MSLHPVMAEALAPFTRSLPFKDWRWLNHHNAITSDLFLAERSRHDRAMEDGIGEHMVSQRCEGHADYYECSCGFKWKADFSG